MIENPVDFVLNVVAGAVTLFCLFDGTRRLGAYGLHRKAVLLVLVSACACAIYGAFAYQKYTDLKGTLSVSQRKPAPASPAGRISSSEKRELHNQTLARQDFKMSGILGTYVDRNGATRTFVPSQEDVKDRERVVAYYSRTESDARRSLAEALLFLIAGLIAVVLGLAMSLDKPPPAARDDAIPENAPIPR